MSRSAPLPPSSVPPERRFNERRADGPRRVKNGLKLSTRDGPIARHPVAERWMAVVEAALSPDAMQQGLEYARAGQIVSLDVMGGEIEARVQGTAARPYVTRLVTAPIDEPAWEALIEAMAGEAIHLAKLLAGDIPPGLDDIFIAHGQSMTPRTIESTCTCAAGGSCKHAAAVAAMFIDQVSAEPQLVFQALGLPAKRLIERLRRARALHTHGVTAAHGESAPPLMSPAPDLEAMIDDFWRSGSDLDAVEWRAPASAVPHALLRRLGPSPLVGKFPMVGLLASIYDAVAQEAQRRRDGES